MPTKYPLQISIPKPCDADWNKMTPTESNRRHCASCAKHVTDFTESTDGEILAAYQKAGGKICGRFRADQLDRQILNTAKAASWWSKAATWASMLFASSQLSAQEIPAISLDTVVVKGYKVNMSSTFVTGLSIIPEEFSQIPTPDIRPVEGMITTSIDAPKKTRSKQNQSTILVQGQVIDKNGEQLPFASVIIVGTANGVVADVDGNFELEVSLGSTLEISYTGYKSKKIKIGRRSGKIIETKSATTQQTTSILHLDSELSTLDIGAVLAGDIIITVYKPNTLFNELKKVLHRRRVRRTKKAEERLARKIARREARIANNNHSSIQRPEVDTVRATNTLVVYPNPSNGPLTLVYHSKVSETAIIEILDIAGHPLLFQHWKVETGKNTYQLERSYFPHQAGSYIIRVADKSSIVVVE